MDVAINGRKRLIIERAVTPQVIRDGQWVRLVSAAPMDLGFHAGDVGAPGLWKSLQSAQGSLVFEAPFSVLHAGAEDFDDEAESSAPLWGFAQWGQQTLTLAVPSTWEPPADVSSAIEQDALTIVSGGEARQAVLVRQTGRLALRCVLGDVPADLPPARRQWLKALIADASERVHMVRIGFAGEGSQCVAEVDLTGVPAALAAPLLNYSAGALRVVAGWLIEPVATIVRSKGFRSLDAFCLRP